MDHRDHVALIRKAVSQKGGVWADFGSGDGAFTLALRELVGKEASIYSIDVNPSSLAVQKIAFREKFPQSNITYMLSDFTHDLPLASLDGIIMANSLHFIKDKKSLLLQIKRYLKKDAKLIIVEYNAQRGNRYVPYPVPFKQLQDMLLECRYTQVEFLAQIPSTFLEQIYAAAAEN